MSFSAAALLIQLRRLPAPRRYWVAFSGGLDSHVLLHALSELRPQLPAPVLAVHVHHGLQAQAEEWVVHCQGVCAQLKIELQVRRINAQPRPGESPEATARAARYQVLSELLLTDDLLLTAQHQNDQAETLLLQLLRGAGVNGLAAMPVYRVLGQGFLARPLLNFSRAMLLAYALQHHLCWVEDPSNADLNFDRNFIRYQILPLLHTHWPKCAITLARAAAQQADAMRLLHDLAAMDWALVQAEASLCIVLSKLRGLTAPRQRNLLRYWIKEINRLPLPDHRRLARIIDELLPARPDANPAVICAGTEVRRYRDRLYALPPRVSVPAGWSRGWDLVQALPLPDGITYLQAQPVQGQGLRHTCVAAGVEIRYRHGGEALQLPGRRHHHALKKLLQQWGVPPWQRDCIPLVYIQDQLAQVVGYCVTAAFAAHREEAGIVITQVHPASANEEQVL
ncbi:MAG: tRNA lysidine(34) synthetase TilS [Gammaproteobacteria bacterium]|nr:tRNA lysidine(34) synthetase TilS [Gammaproteobacteria bacterium]